jgi:probable rRNA maturation factor
MNFVELQIAVESEVLPSEQQIQAWIDAALEEISQDTEIVIRVVDETEMAQLNQQYRDKQGPTNILSFPFEAPPGLPSMPIRLLGDLVICALIVEREAKAQKKSIEHHWAHIIVHGVLHLLGYDHIAEAEADRMEAKEITILKRFNINNPYIYEV